MSQAKIYVGNLSYSTTSDELHQLFSQHGEIEEVKLITDRETGRSKGYGFVTYKDPAAAQKAVEVTNGQEVNGRSLKVNMARNDDRDRRGSGGGGRGPGGRGGPGGFRPPRRREMNHQ